MKRLLIAVALAALTLPAFAANVGVSISIGDPGYYGRLRLDVGYPEPQLMYRRAFVVQPVPRGRRPIYLRVPPGHARNWHRHCREYNACNERVYFVRDDWYENDYAPRYRKDHGRRHDDRRDHRKDKYRRSDRRDDRDDGKQGRGRDH